jgi:two-component system, NarL family, nitrate/nitrite response regulator NarL
MIDLVLADDHPIVLAGMENMFRRERDCRVVASCVDGVEALRAIARHEPSVAVLDLRMPRMDGLGVMRELQKEARKTRIVLLAAALDDDDVLEAVHLGVRGVILKEMAVALVVQCVREVHAGRQWLEKRSVTQALEKFTRRQTATRDLEKILTTREFEVARAVAAGLRNKEIAAKLQIAEGTVKIHLHAIYEKLNLDGRMSLVLRLKEKAVL